MAPKKESAPEEKPDPLPEWREDQFRRMGIPEDDVSLLVRANVDTHEVRRLVIEKRCPVHMVAQILL